MVSLVVTYGGKGGPRSGHIREGRRGIANPKFSFQADETPTLRLNSDHGLRFPPDFLATVPTNTEKLTYLHREIAGALDQFAPYQHKFLDRYFAFIVDRCANSAETLDRNLSWSGGLLNSNDFVFSALWPLPDCTVSGWANSELGTASNFDFAFWSGRQLIAVSLAGNAKRIDETENDGTTNSNLVHRIKLAAADINSEEEIFTEQWFPPELIRFWQGENVPCSPFRPDGLSPTVEDTL